MSESDTVVASDLLFEQGRRQRRVGSPVPVAPWVRCGWYFEAGLIEGQDGHNRDRALFMAIDHHRSSGGGPAEKVVATARTFLRFLADDRSGDGE